MKAIFAAVLTAMLALESFGQEESSQWRGPERNGNYPDRNLLRSWPAEGPSMLWKFDSLGSGYSSPAVTGDRIIVTGTADSITYAFCFDHQGSLLWKRPLGRDWMGDWPGIRSTPVIAGDRAYVVSSLGTLSCISTLNGDPVWTKDLIKEYQGNEKMNGFLDNLIVDGDLVYCAPGGAARNVVALNRFTGALIWESKNEKEISGFGSPILIEHEGVKYYVYQDAGAILALKASDGSQAWRFARPDATTVGTPLYRDGLLFTLNGEGSLQLKLGQNTPAIAWSQPGFFPLQGDPVLLGNRLYGKDPGKKYRCIDWTTGAEIGSIPVKAMVVTSITADGLIFTYDIDGNVSLLKPVDSGMEITGNFRIPGGTKYHCSHPVIRDGRLYVRHDNSLFVYQVSAHEGKITSN